MEIRTSHKQLNGTTALLARILREYRIPAYAGSAAADQQ